ncbi:hypothetical protein [Nonomuraea jabiensis]|uniref:LysR substrate-binding domain-containing protein n=1 Tax=Nonomuraea jabiensis TaxID=882448 RepID=A0A7W9FXG9_9ACTN|nr:hypothetical protein [Nonomuraea jabiensis]MBB5773375.1 hypothetical protein [Nonomuraea jabiensis]
MAATEPVRLGYVSWRPPDLTICWVRADDLAAHGLEARLIGADRLFAVSTGTGTSAVPAKDTSVLVDADTATWDSWNRYAEEFARDTGARVVRVDDGGIIGPAFFDHVRRLRRPVVNSPKGQTAPVPPDLARRPVVDPAPYWTWALVSRRDETRMAVRAAVEALTRDVGGLGLDAEAAWLPAGDPFRTAG